MPRIAKSAFVLTALIASVLVALLYFALLGLAWGHEDGTNITSSARFAHRILDFISQPIRFLGLADSLPGWLAFISMIILDGLLIAILLLGIKAAFRFVKNNGQANMPRK